MTIPRARELLEKEAESMTDGEILLYIQQTSGLCDVLLEQMEKEVKELGVKNFKKKYKKLITDRNTVAGNTGCL